MPLYYIPYQLFMDMEVGMADEKPKVAAIYTRTSSDEDGKEGGPRESIAAQEAVCKKLVASQGYTLAPEHIFSDANFSGRTYPTGCPLANQDKAFQLYFDAYIHSEQRRTRPGLGALFAVLDQIDVIVVRDITRVLRPHLNSFLGGYIWQQLNHHEVVIHSVAENIIRPDDHGHQLITGLTLASADRAKIIEVERSRESLRKMKDEGALTHCSNFYGFRYLGRQKAQAVSEEQAIVREIFDRFLRGESQLSIARELNGRNVHTLNHDRWSKALIQLVLRQAPGRHAIKPGDGETIPGIKSILREICDMAGRGVSALSIARELVKRKVPMPSMYHSRWSQDTVRKILQRAYYCGYQKTSAGDFVRSQVFFPDKDPTITLDEFLTVQKAFARSSKATVDSPWFANARARRKEAKQSLRGGSRIGTSKDGFVHPFSGLVKCGICGHHLYSFQGSYAFFGQTFKIPYLICKTPQYDKSKKECNLVRIKEYYPQALIERGTKPYGLGLVEGVFPLLFAGYVARATNAQVSAELTAKMANVDLQLAEVAAAERMLFEKMERGSLKEKQFDNLMAVKAKLRDRLTLERDDLDTRRQKLIARPVVIERDYLTKPGKVPMTVLRELAQDTLDSILVYPDMITVKMKEGIDKEFDIERVRMRSGRGLPFWKVTIDTKSITTATKITVEYFYKTSYIGIIEPMITIKVTDSLQVMTLGSNVSIDKKRGHLFRNPDILTNHFGPPPNMAREMVVTSWAFFSRDPDQLAEEMSHIKKF